MKLIILFIFNFIFIQYAVADWGWDFFSKKGVTPVNDKLYLEECGACHFPYQPGLLPMRSWQKILNINIYLIILEKMQNLKQKH